MSALYEWNYPRQMLHARLTEAGGASLEEREHQIFSERFLLKRPLLEAITEERSPVLLSTKSIARTKHSKHFFSNCSANGR